MNVAMACLLLASSACSPRPAQSAASAQTSQQPAALLPALPRSRIVLMSSLPLVYGEPDDMSALIAGQGEPHPLYVALNAAHDLVVADALDSDGLVGADMVILIQPRALPPEALVALDDYVRGGGRLMVFADPVLDWPSRLGFGDPRGPLRSALVSPLFAHWGLELVDPGSDTVRLPKSGAVLLHPGRFAVRSGTTGDAGCVLSEADHVARCRPGKGQAILVADADLLAPTYLSDPVESRDANRRFFRGLLQDLSGERLP